MASVFDAAAPELLRVATHLARDRATAEDLVQATFLTAIEVRERFEVGRSVLAWLCGILANHARRSRAERKRLPSLPDASVSAGIEWDPSEVAVRADVGNAVTTAIDALPKLYRPVVRRHLERGMGSVEIARELDRSPATIRKQLARGMVKLRRALPAGLSLGIASTGASQSLARLRARVLDSVVTMPRSPWIFGGLAFMKKLILPAAVLLLALTAALTWWPDRYDSDVGRAAASEATTETEPPAANSKPLAVAGAHSSRTANRRQVADQLGSIEVRLLWADDRTPVAAVRVRALPLGRATPSFGASEAVTSLDGRVTFAQLQPGTWRIECDRGIDRDLTVRAGERQSLSVMIPSGLRVVGIVVDSADRPVPGADVWLAETEFFDRGSVVARTAGDGRFELRGVGRGRGIAARAAGYHSAALQPVDGAVDGVVTMRFVLEPGGSRVAGRVVDPAGEPVAGAFVCVGHVVKRGFLAPGRSPQSQAPPAYFTRTDADGHFEASGLSSTLRAQIVRVRAEGFATWSEPCLVDEPSPRVIVLERGRRGELRFVGGERREPCPGLRVTLCPGRYWRQRGAPRWAFDHATTDADGLAVFPRLPSGSVLVGVAGDANWLAASIPIQVGAGDGVLTREWAMRPAATLSGVVLDAAGNGIANCGLRVTDGLRAISWATADTSGRFMVEGCRPDAILDLRVFESGDAPTVSIAHRTVQCGAAVEVRIPDAARGTGAISGRLATEGGAAAPGAMLRLVPGDESPSVDLNSEDRTGAFLFSGVPSGRYRLYAYSHDASVSLGEHEVVSGQELALGVLVIRDRDAIVLTARTLEGRARHCTFEVFAADADAAIERGPLGSLEVRVAVPSPGSYRVRVVGEFEPVERRVDVVAGADARCRVVIPDKDR